MKDFVFIYNVLGNKQLDNLETVHYKPEPTSKHLPEWYKSLENYVQGNKKKPSDTNGTSGTIKKCNPVFDILTAGYFIFTHTDIYIDEENGSPYFQWKANDAISFHDGKQALNHPYFNSSYANLPKFTNVWGIKTSKGYSTLFMPPAHRDNPLIILGGIVDTDNYHVPVSFPFVVKEGFKGLVPAGTPIAQVIPIKRDNWKMSIGSKELMIQSKRMFIKLTSVFFDGYRNNFWVRKSYK
jgi:hypothetical protein